MYGAMIQMLVSPKIHVEILTPKDAGIEVGPLGGT